MDQSSRRRAGAFQIFFCLLFLGLISRLYCVQIVDHADQLAKRDIQVTGKIEEDLPPGPILDKRGQLLAVSVPKKLAWVNPSAIADKAAAARALAPVLDMKEGVLLDQLSGVHGKKFTVLKHRLTDEQVAGVNRLLADPLFKFGGRSTEQKLGLRTEYQRQYPQGPLFGPVIGHDAVEAKNKEGLERTLAPLLDQAPRSVQIWHDGKQQVIGAPSLDLDSTEAVLTIDLLLQRVVEEELDAACNEHRPKWAVAVAMNPKTGEILAIANRPSYDPNRPGEAPADARLNRVVTFPYEPGSTLKPFTCAYALDLEVVKPDTMIDCENGLWHHGPRTLHDHHPYAKITLADVIKFSSNIGAAKVGALMLGQKRLYECMKRWGFGERTGVDLPAEDSGLLFPLSRWTIYSDTSVPMGHEISVTPLQLCTAMSAIANGGTLYRPYIVQRVKRTDGTVIVDNGPQPVRRVIGDKASKQMIEILKGVVQDGTGKKAAVNGVAVAGKTGTSQKIDPRTHQYTHEKYIASFVGFAPADDASLCIAVVLDEPQGGSYYGGAVAAPVVGRIIQRGLAYVK
ncbi:MAG TPA: penicillin-binding protein 2 [Planctomycetota bacterium]|nr:penicillin-binding protein 2 [Planctomycetota bacterium]